MSMIFLRIGSNAEKRYVERVGALFSGLVVRGNFFEASPGMLSGLLCRLAGLAEPRRYMIDPVTYAFALDPMPEGGIRSWQRVSRDRARPKLADDLRIPEAEVDDDWIRPVQRARSAADNAKCEVYSIKRSYRTLADKTLGRLAEHAGLRPVLPSDLEAGDIQDELVVAAIQYQQEALPSRFAGRRYAGLAEALPDPMYILSPYFPVLNDQWLGIMRAIWSRFCAHRGHSEGMAVLQSTSAYLHTRLEGIVRTLAGLDVPAIGLWIDDFEEEHAPPQQLADYVDVVHALRAAGKTVVNLYGGGLSNMLYPFGLGGMTNSPGYGEFKPIAPISGGFAVAKYYVPPMHTRQNVDDAHFYIRAAELGRTPSDFWRDVCGCPICRDGIRSGLADLITYFNERELGEQGRYFPTARALERCRFHFLLCRLIEFRWSRSASREQVLARLQADCNAWEAVGDAAQHLRVWLQVLRDRP